jgi:hypothetical protein
LAWLVIHEAVSAQSTVELPSIYVIFISILIHFFNLFPNAIDAEGDLILRKNIVKNSKAEIIIELLDFNCIEIVYVE